VERVPLDQVAEAWRRQGRVAELQAGDRPLTRGPRVRPVLGGVDRRGWSSVRDRLTWIAYVVLAWFAYLQAAPGCVIAHLRDELDLSYSTGGLHVAAFAAGAMLAGVDPPTARARARAGARCFWSAAALMGAGRSG
jgi:hypothetical protein